ncbi:hypothetical protein [Aurantimonas endophytica]|uniref:hypothetical protein n=1 Tax=Aurantimonas endophytica TaxID=1522175 RepID=UPI00300197BA
MAAHAREHEAVRRLRIVRPRQLISCDLDVLIDFPAGTDADPWPFLEDLSQKQGMPIDIHNAGYCKEAFVDRVMAEGKLVG